MDPALSPDRPRNNTPLVGRCSPLPSPPSLPPVPSQSPPPPFCFVHSTVPPLVDEDPFDEDEEDEEDAESSGSPSESLDSDNDSSGYGCRVEVPRSLTKGSAQPSRWGLCCGCHSACLAGVPPLPASCRHDAVHAGVPPLLQCMHGTEASPCPHSSGLLHQRTPSSRGSSSLGGFQQWSSHRSRSARGWG